MNVLFRFFLTQMIYFQTSHFNILWGDVVSFFSRLIFRKLPFCLSTNFIVFYVEKTYIFLKRLQNYRKFSWLFLKSSKFTRSSFQTTFPFHYYKWNGKKSLLLGCQMQALLFLKQDKILTYKLLKGLYS